MLNILIAGVSKPKFGCYVHIEPRMSGTRVASQLQLRKSVCSHNHSNGEYSPYSPSLSSADTGSLAVRIGAKIVSHTHYWAERKIEVMTCFSRYRYNTALALCARGLSASTLGSRDHCCRYIQIHYSFLHPRHGGDCKRLEETGGDCRRLEETAGDLRRLEETGGDLRLTTELERYTSVKLLLLL